MTSEAYYKCPNCGHMTMGVKPGRNAQPVLCPKCMREGITVVMTESKDDGTRYAGAGFHVKKKNLNESKQLLNEGA